MKIITRYVLKQHIGPLIFALTALTSLLMLQYVARQLGNLVGKGIPWKVIGEFFVLSLPFTIAMTMPMAVLVATLHAFGRMASENEITAFKANGVRVTRLMMPVLIGAGFLVIAMVGFNDQVLPRANHKLRMLQQDMARAKPTLALEEQVLNQLTNAFYMRIGHLNRDSNLMHDVTLYDLTDPQNRKTIYADSGELSFTPDKKDLQLVLYNGYQQELGTASQSQLQRSYFRSQAVRVKDIGGEFEQTGNDSWKGNREKSVCEMQSEYVANAQDYERVRQMYIEALRRGALPGQKTLSVPRPRPATEGIARLYCNALALVFRVPTAQPKFNATSSQVTAQNPTSVTPGSVPGQLPAVGPPGAPGNGQPLVDPTTGNVVTPPTKVLPPALQAQVDAAKAALAIGAQLPPPPPSQISQPISAPVVAMAKTGLDSVKNVASATTAKSDSNAASTAGATQPPQTPPAIATDSALKVLPSSPASAVGAVTAAATSAAGAPQPSSVAVVPQPSSVAGVPPASTPTPTTTPAPVFAQPIPGSAPPAATTLPPNVSAVAGNVNTALVAFSPAGGPAEIAAANSQLSVVRASMDDLAVEVQKKFALSVACIVFVLFGPPIALRFPRGGVGATLGVSLVVFGLYYICLMAGETLADDGKLPPAIAMWAANIIFTVLGLLLLLRIEKTADASRGGGIRGWFEDRKAKRALRRVRVTTPSTAPV